MISKFYAVTELAGLPGMPSEIREVRRLAYRQGWVRERLRMKGGPYKYSLVSLPAETRIHLLRQLGAELCQLFSEYDPLGQAGQDLHEEEAHLAIQVALLSYAWDVWVFSAPR